MAFRVPQQQRPYLPLQVVNDQSKRRDPVLETPTSFGAGLTNADSEEWVVFSPSSFGAETTQTTSTGLLGRGSEYDSLASHEYDEDGEERLDDVEEEEDDDDEDDDNDIDLHGFRDPFHQGPVMLPTHDGMGTFATATPQRSYDHTMQFSPPSMENSFANSRIQAWRMEQSRILLDEIERVTRGRLALKMTELDLREEEAAATLGDVGNITEEADGHLDEVIEDQETFWKRLTRKVMRDIMGLDDMVLQVIFGESLPMDLDDITPSNSPQTKRSFGKHDTLRKLDERWEDRFLERLAKELGVLVNQYTQHPTVSAFSTYNRENTTLDDGAETPQARSRSPSGVPISIPTRPSIQRKESVSSVYTHVSSSVDPLTSNGNFEPTLRPITDEVASHAANWGIEDRPNMNASAATANTDARMDAEVVREYWEKELNVRMLFSYLKSRFSTSSPPFPSNIQTADQQQQQQRPQHNARSRRPSHSSIRTTTTTPAQGNKYNNHVPFHHHHPLIHRQPSQRNSRLSTTTRSSSGVKDPRSIASSFITPFTASVSSAIGFGFPAFGGVRSASSCASETTKKLARKTVSKSSNSTRHYWEVASSVGSGRSSCVGVGVWGEI